MSHKDKNSRLRTIFQENRLILDLPGRMLGKALLVSAYTLGGRRMFRYTIDGTVPRVELPLDGKPGRDNSTFVLDVAANDNSCRDAVLITLVK